MTPRGPWANLTRQALIFVVLVATTAAFQVPSFGALRRPAVANFLACAHGHGSENSEQIPRREFGHLAAAASLVTVCPDEGAAAKKKDEKKTRDNPVIATDKDMAEVTAGAWLASHRGIKDRDLVVGLNGDPYWLIAKKPTDGAPKQLEACTHLGCIAGWRPELGKYVCACHGSEYDKQGVKLRGPAPRSLDLARVSVDGVTGAVQLSKWADDDFRSQAPSPES